MTDDKKPTPSLSHVDDFVQALAEQGELHSAGGFTLDRDVAREKMQRFGLAEPHSYVLELVQAAVLKGATRIDFDIDADDMRMSFNGRPFTQTDFSALYDALFTEGEGDDWEARRQLAIALHAAEGLKPAFIAIVSGGNRHEQSVQLVLTPGKPDQLHTQNLMDKRTHIHVKQRLSKLDLGRVRENIAGRLPEEIALRERCGWARLPILLDGEQISIGTEIPSDQSIVQFEDGALWGLAKHHPEHDKQAVYLVCNGVNVASRELPTSERSPGGFAAVVSSPHFRKDLSQRDVVENDVYERALALAEQALDTATRVACLALHKQDTFGARTQQLHACPCWEVAQTPTDTLWHVQTDGPDAVLLFSSTGRVHIRDAEGLWDDRRLGREHKGLTAAWAPRWSELVVADEDPSILIHRDGHWKRSRTVGIAAHSKGKPAAAESPPKPAGPKLPFTTYELSDETNETKSRKREGTPIHALWAVRPESVWAAGGHGRLFHYHDSKWQRHDTHAKATLHGVWAASDEHVFAVGDDNTLVRRRPSGWERSRDPGSHGDWRGVWGTSPVNVVAVGSGPGDGSDTNWAVTRYNGHRWTRMELPELAELAPDDFRRLARQRLQAIWGSSSSDVFAVGSHGLILHHNGHRWELMESPTQQDLLSVWGSGPEDVWAVGRNHTRLHYDGERWSPLAPPLTTAYSSLADLAKQVGGSHRFAHIPGPENLPARLLQAVGANPALCIRSELPDEWLNTLAMVLGGNQISRA